jgi:hypothetical protein
LDERSEVTYLTILGGALLVIGAWLGITVTLVMAIDAFGLRSALRSAGRASPDLSFGASQETVQSWSAVLGILIAATISRWRNADERRP